MEAWVIWWHFSIHSWERRFTVNYNYLCDCCARLSIWIWWCCAGCFSNNNTYCQHMMLVQLSTLEGSAWDVLIYREKWLPGEKNTHFLVNRLGYSANLLPEYQGWCLATCATTAHHLFHNTRKWQWWKPCVSQASSVGLGFFTVYCLYGNELSLLWSLVLL